MRLFWKVFITLIAVLSLTALVSGWLGQHWLIEQHAVESRIDSLKEQGETAAELYIEEGPSAYRRWLVSNMRRHHSSGLLINEHGEHVLPRPLPSHAKALLARLQQGERGIHIIRPPRLIWADAVSSEGRTWYWIASTHLPPGVIQQGQRVQTIVYLLAAFLIVLAASLFLGRMITRPISLLRQTSRQLGEGHLEARPPETLLLRQDEMGQLARDFNTMGEKVDSLLTSHKQLLRDISHELRSPLARLQVALELARGKQVSDSEELDRIETEAGRINDLIEEVLTLARFDQGAVAIQKEPLRLDMLLQQLSQDLDFEASSQDCEIHLACEQMLTVNADGRWMERAIENIARNAIRHAPSGSSIDISLGQESEYAVISIHDRGPGVEEDKLPHLFEPFYRASEGRERQSGGYGLGLAIASKVVEACLGSIQAANHPDGGLEVTLKLPLA